MAKRGINRVTLVGNLGQDPEVRFMPNGGAVANFTVATSESWKDKNTGEQKEETEWSRIVVYGRLAEICGEYLKKGSKVYLEGKLKTRKWQNQQGQDQYSTEVICHDMQMLDSRNGSQAPVQQQGGFQQQRTNPNAPMGSNANQHLGQQQGGFNQSQQGGFNKPQSLPTMAQQEAQQEAQQNAQKVNPQEPTTGFDDDIPF